MMAVSPRRKTAKLKNDAVVNLRNMTARLATELEELSPLLFNKCAR